MVYGFVESLTALPQDTFGVLAGMLSVAAYVPYVVGIIRGQTYPERASWFLWSILGTIAFAGQLYEGASASLAFVGVQVGGTILISVLSIWRGYGAFWHRRNIWIFSLAGAGILLWYWLDSAAYALAVTISISLLGGVVTVVKSYVAPGTETMTTWATFWLASFLAVLSVGSMDLVLLAYPLYLLVLYTGIVAAMIKGRDRQVRAIPFVTTRV